MTQQRGARRRDRPTKLPVFSFRARFLIRIQFLTSVRGARNCRTLSVPAVLENLVCRNMVRVDVSSEYERGPRIIDIRQSRFYWVISQLPLCYPYMDAVLEQLRSEGHPLSTEDLARLSPLLFDHINFLGRYAFALPDSVAHGQLRPLRSTDTPEDE
jgi:hypothetical protein